MRSENEFHEASRTQSTCVVAVLGALLGLAQSSFAAPQGGITVDGRLDEPQWATAQVFDDFVETDPMTRAKPKHSATLRVLATPEGLCFGIRVNVPRAERTHGFSPRDATSLDGDPFAVDVDFEGRGRTAYEFAVSLSGSVRDAIILNQVDFSTDWDAVWYSAIHEEDEWWSAEMMIPWSVAPEGAVQGDHRTIAFYAAWGLKQTGVLSSYPAIERFTPTWVQAFQKITAPRYKVTDLSVVPYSSMSNDSSPAHTMLRAGADLSWRLSGQNTLVGTIKPDFGQVESDDLVVNFTPIETFFADKRPFFTEGQQLFDLRTNQNGRLVYTRRIGAAPDSGPEAVSNVLAGFKYTGAHESLDYGAFGAIEESTSEATGRQFAAARLRRTSGDTSVGVLATYARHPTLDRDAAVVALDGDSRLTQDWALRGQFISTLTHERPAQLPTDSASKAGLGAWWALQYAPHDRQFKSALRATYFDRRFDINDMGYMERNSLRQLVSDTVIERRHFSPSSPLDFSSWEVILGARSNDLGVKLPAILEVSKYLVFHSGNDLMLTYHADLAGTDDLLTRGNGNVLLGTRSAVTLLGDLAQSGRFRGSGYLKIYQQGVRGWTEEISLQPRLFLRENLSTGISVTWTHSDDWLIWRDGAGLAGYASDQVATAFRVDWFASQHQDFNLKAQWIGLRAGLQAGYQLTADGSLVQASTLARDFSLTSIALQARYHYQVAPLRDLYIVYSRGANAAVDSLGPGLGSQFHDAFAHPQTSQWFAKFSWRM